MTIIITDSAAASSSLDGKLFSDDEVLEIYELRREFEGRYDSLRVALTDNKTLNQIMHNPNGFLDPIRKYVQRCAAYENTRLLAEPYREMNKLLVRAESLLLGKLGTYKKQNGE